MSININSEAQCRQAYLNYHCYGNTMNISAEEMGEITKAWESKLTSWQATVSKDENKYEFDDSDYASYKENGKKVAQDQTGYKGGKGNMIGRGVGDCALAAGTTFMAVGGKIAMKGVGKAVGAIGKAVGGKAGKKVADAAGNIAANKTVDGAGKAAKVSDIVTVILASVTAATYFVKKPNKEQKEACDELQNVMANNQTALADTQAEMENMANELIELSDEANEANEDANTNIEDEKTKYDMYKASYEALKAKAESGEPLTEDEKALYQELIKYMTDSGANITEIQEDTTDVVGEIYEDMGTYQDGYDYAVETMGEVEGTTDFAAGFDSTTKTMCYVEAGVQGLNAISATIAATKLMSKLFIGWGFAAIGFAAAASSTIASAQQIKWAGEVGNEIDIRKDTQDFNTETMDMYDEEIDAYDGYMQGIEELEIEIPDDIEAPEATPLPENEDGYPDGTPDSIKLSDGEGNQPKTPAANASNGYTSYTDIVNGKAGNSETVTDGTGKVLLSSQYANAITQALGVPFATSGDKFDTAKIPDIISKLTPGVDVDTIRTVMNGGKLDSSFEAQGVTILGKPNNKTIDNSEYYTQKIKSIINFYKPMLDAAALNGWKCG